MLKLACWNSDGGMRPWAFVFCGRITTPLWRRSKSWETTCGSPVRKKDWANQSAETWHDNFGYEQEQQHQWALSERAESLVELKNEAEIVERRIPGGVDIGSRVTIENTENGERKSFVVGSYQVLDRQHDNEISYVAPLARPFMGAAVGEEREVTIGDSTTLFRVVAVA
jgi:transcription elongation GreA/GreB family factor